MPLSSFDLNSLLLRRECGGSSRTSTRVSEASWVMKWSGLPVLHGFGSFVLVRMKVWYDESDVCDDVEYHAPCIDL